MVGMMMVVVSSYKGEGGEVLVMVTVEIVVVVMVVLW